jgi:hypothetical protein
MKLKFTLLPAACIFMSLMMVQPVMASGKMPGVKNEEDGKSAKKAKTQSRNNTAVKI